MSSSNLTLVLDGDDDSIAWEILSFAGMSEDFPDADFALLDNSDIMDLAYKHADDWDEKVFDSGAPGGCSGVFKFYAKEPEEFRTILREDLRPICRALVDGGE